MKQKRGTLARPAGFAFFGARGAGKKPIWLASCRAFKRPAHRVPAARPQPVTHSHLARDLRFTYKWKAICANLQISTHRKGAHHGAEITVEHRPGNGRRRW